MPTATKFCLDCKKIKNTNKFGKDRTKPDGRQWRCKVCARKNRKERYKTAYVSDESRFKSVRSQATHRGKIWEISFEEWLCLVVGKDKRCTYCWGSLPETGSGLDRMDNSRGYVTGNVTSCCRTCNEIKSDKFSYEEMLGIMNLVRYMRGLDINEPIWPPYVPRNAVAKQRPIKPSIKPPKQCNEILEALLDIPCKYTLNSTKERLKPLSWDD